MRELVRLNPLFAMGFGPASALRGLSAATTAGVCSNPATRTGLLAGGATSVPGCCPDPAPAAAPAGGACDGFGEPAGPPGGAAPPAGFVLAPTDTFTPTDAEGTGGTTWLAGAVCVLSTSAGAELGGAGGAGAVYVNVTGGSSVSVAAGVDGWAGLDDGCAGVVLGGAEVTVDALGLGDALALVVPEPLGEALGLVKVTGSNVAPVITPAPFIFRCTGFGRFRNCWQFRFVYDCCKRIARNANRSVAAAVSGDVCGTVSAWSSSIRVTPTVLRLAQ
jgi:hypothetical protein